MRRREVITLLGAAAGWPFVARAQRPALPLVGYLSVDGFQGRVQDFHRGLSDAGFVQGRSVTIEYRFSEQGQYGRLPMLAADLVRLPLAVLFAGPVAAAAAAKAATATIPIVFAIGGDPVDMGLAASLNRPGGNVTGVTFLAVELAAKRLELLRELVPKIASVALLVNPNNPTTPIQTKDMRLATTALGLHLDIVSAGSQSDLGNVFATLVRQRADALVISADSVFASGRDQLVMLASRHSLPVVSFEREYVEAGGLISYGSDIGDAFRLAATYVGRILKGEKPADLPIMQPTKFELVINMKTAKALGLTVPLTLHAIADLVIE
jgi:putative ABC transport system substrate-binding protein